MRSQATPSTQTSPHGHPPDDKTFTLTFEDNRLLSVLFGEHDEHLALIEHRLAVAITPRGNRVAIRGEAANVENARAVLLALYGRATRGQEITRGEVDGAVRMAKAQSEKDVTEGAVRTRRSTRHRAGRGHTQARAAGRTPRAGDQDRGVHRYRQAVD